ncbi:MAG: 8-amino-7-oxononanoate synthase [Vulcanimicrobiaceae bacterium]
MTYLARVTTALDDLAARSLRRELRTALPLGALDFTSNDYLGLSREPAVVDALAAATQVGSGGSRLLSGAHAEHAGLEADLAAWTGRERALLFSSGYLAALGAIVTLAPFVERIRSDAQLHACGIDAIRLTKRDRATYPHDRYRAHDDVRTMVVTESLFSMSGTRVDIAALLRRLGPHDILVVDEAHALGIAGPRGAGLCAGQADPRIVVVGTLSKALGGLGGFVAGPAVTIAYLATAARTFVFDTSLPPALASGPRGDAARARLRENVATLVAGLRELDPATPDAAGPIVPIVIGDAAEAFALGRALEALGIFAPALRPPTVARGAAQLRVTLRADHARGDIVAFLDAFADVRYARGARGVCGPRGARDASRPS